MNGQLVSFIKAADLVSLQRERHLREGEGLLFTKALITVCSVVVTPLSHIRSGAFWQSHVFLGKENQR